MTRLAIAFLVLAAVLLLLFVWGCIVAAGRADEAEARRWDRPAGADDACAGDTARQAGALRLFASDKPFHRRSIIGDD